MNNMRLVRKGKQMLTRIADNSGRLSHVHAAFYVLLSCSMMIIPQGCGGRSNSHDSHRDPSSSSAKLVPSQNDEVMFCIDNSGSMDGYINGNTEFKDVISNLFIRTEYLYDKKHVSLNFVNSAVFPIKNANTQSFIGNLNPSAPGWTIGGSSRQTSNLNNIFDNILGKVDTHTVTILASDCIYSVQGKAKAVNNLTMQKNLTMSNYLTALNKLHFNTVLVKLQSKFTGKYFPMHGKPYTINGQYRPYYLWFIGTSEELEKYFKNILIKDLNGFQHGMFFTSTPAVDEPQFTILLKTCVSGTLVPDRKFSTKDRIGGITKLELHNGAAGFCLAVDLRKYFLDDDYFLTSGMIEASNNFNATVIPLQPNRSVDQTDQHYLDAYEPGYTHLIHLRTSRGTQKGSINIEGRIAIPAWVDSTSTIDDLSNQQHLGQTFGFKYLVDGVFQAYQTASHNRKSYFKIRIPINGDYQP